MKCGTSSLHHILGKNPDIFIPNDEIGFFDIDDIEAHPDFFVYESNKWYYWDYEKNFGEYLEWYKSFFSQARKDQIIGEDSTTYFSSKKPAERIKDLLPDCKLIFLLRDPVKRCYSHYWHNLRSGRAFNNFEKTIQMNTRPIITKGFYKDKIKNYKKHFSKDNLKFIIFENFVSNTQEVISEVCDFIGVGRIDVSDIETHQNPGKVLFSPKLQVYLNRLMKKRFRKKYVDTHLPGVKKDKNITRSNIIKSLFNKISTDEYPPMKKETKNFLEKLYSRENKGISDLINKKIEKFWPYME